MRDGIVLEFLVPSAYSVHSAVSYLQRTKLVFESLGGAIKCMYKVMISVGEASGDLHGANVAKALKEIQPDIEIFGMGGRDMRAAGVEILYDVADLGVIGFVEVVKNLPRLFRLRDMLVAEMKARRPDVLVVIDYPDFNMRLAKFAKPLGIPVVSYISPTVWAWRRGRAKGVAETMAKVAAIFPFEAEVYREYGANVEFVGHPLVDVVKPALTRAAAYAYFQADPARPIVLLLPGSRQQEITNLLPVMLEAAAKVEEQQPGCQFFLPVASTISREILQTIIAQNKINVVLTQDNTYDLMNIADIGIAASGTVTLEAALLDLPTVVIYKMATLTYWIGKMLVKIPYISLPNIIAGRQVVPELLQHAVTPEAIAAETLAVLAGGEVSRLVHAGLAEVRAKLGQAGAVDRVAQLIIETAASATGGQ